MGRGAALQAHAWGSCGDRTGAASQPPSWWTCASRNSSRGTAGTSAGTVPLCAGVLIRPVAPFGEVPLVDGKGRRTDRDWRWGGRASTCSRPYLLVPAFSASVSAGRWRQCTSACTHEPSIHFVSGPPAARAEPCLVDRGPREEIKSFQIWKVRSGTHLA